MPTDSKPAVDDRTLLAAVMAGDASAFAELSQRTSGMVYATCLRVLGDAHLAQDATQETFLQLLRHAHGVTGCVAAWLHRVATNKALDLARGQSRLRARERSLAAPVEKESWSELSALVDEALEQLNDDQRRLIVRHFLEGRSQLELSEEMQISQPTVSRQLSEALEAMRLRLRQLGVIASVSLLHQGWSEERLVAAPPTLQAELGKMALSTPPAAVGTSLGVLGALALVTVAVAIVILRQPHVVAAAVAAPAPVAAGSSTTMVQAPTTRAPTDGPVDQALMTRAVTAVCSGDATTLKQLLHDHPALVRWRVQSDVGHYAGYFHHATLLHHVAGNPLPATIPANVVDIARILLAAGAEVDAHTDAGPKQPTDPGWTTLGLLVSCGPAMDAHVDELVDVLVSAGANIDDANGSVLGGALQYMDWKGASALVRQGAKLDLLYAAAMGNLSRVQEFFDATGALKPGSVFLAGYPQLHGPIESQGGYAHGSLTPRLISEQLAQALAFAATFSENPHRLEVVRFLLDHGAKSLMTAYGDTALHHAAWIGDLALSRMLLEGGADASTRDAQYKATPADWADYHHHPDCAAMIRAWKPGALPPAPPRPGF